MFTMFLWTADIIQSSCLVWGVIVGIILLIQYIHPYLENTTMFSDKYVQQWNHAWTTQSEGGERSAAETVKELQGLVTLREEGHWDSRHQRHQVSALAMPCYLTHTHPTMFCLHLLVLSYLLICIGFTGNRWCLHGLSMSQASGPRCFQGSEHNMLHGFYV